MLKFRSNYRKQSTNRENVRRLHVQKLPGNKVANTEAL